MDVSQTFDAIADRYPRMAARSSHNAYFERPAMLQLLGQNLKGLRVLDVGAASGFYLAHFLEQGAQPTGIDISPLMVEGLRQKFGSRVPLYHADIAGDTPFLQDRSFDLVFCSLMLHYVQDWDALLQKFHRLLVPEGRLLVSIGHPFDDQKTHPESNYRKCEAVSDPWPSFGVEVPFYRRSLAETINAFLRNGFRLEQLHEPEPLPELQSLQAKWYDALMQEPPFLCLDCRHQAH